VPASSAAARQAAPIDDRHLDRDGCFDIRDVGGLAAARRHALGAPGVRTVADLHNAERAA
jgi:hypothetical protein